MYTAHRVIHIAIVGLFRLLLSVSLDAGNKGSLHTAFFCRTWTWCMVMRTVTATKSSVAMPTNIHERTCAGTVPSACAYCTLQVARAAKGNTYAQYTPTTSGGSLKPGLAAMSKKNIISAK